MRAAQQAKTTIEASLPVPIFEPPFSIFPTLNITSNSKRVNPFPLDRKRIEFWGPNAQKSVVVFWHVRR